MARSRHTYIDTGAKSQASEAKKPVTMKQRIGVFFSVLGVLGALLFAIIEIFVAS